MDNKVIIRNLEYFISDEDITGFYTVNQLIEMCREGCVYDRTDLNETYAETKKLPQRIELEVDKALLDENGSIKDYYTYDIDHFTKLGMETVGYEFNQKEALIYGSELEAYIDLKVVDKDLKSRNYKTYEVYVESLIDDINHYLGKIPMNKNDLIKFSKELDYNIELPKEAPKKQGGKVISNIGR